MNNRIAEWLASDDPKHIVLATDEVFEVLHVGPYDGKRFVAAFKTQGHADDLANWLNERWKAGDIA